MKTNTSITVWINRILMIPFFITLFIGIFENDFLFYSALIAIFLGAFQLFSFLIILVFSKNIHQKLKKCLFIYSLLVLLYFIGVYLILNFFDLNNQLVQLSYYSFPVILSLFWTYILESIKKEI